MIKKFLLVALCAFFYQLMFSPILAVKAYPFPITVTQPDGSQLTIRLHGDEFHHYQTTDDGYLLKENTKGFLTYALVDSTGAVSESKVIARNQNKRTSTEIQFLKTINTSAALVSIQKSPKRSKMLQSASSKPRKAYPLNGSPKALVILTNFKDKAFSVPAPQVSFQNLTTQDGYSANGGTGSAKDYFMASTYGKFAPNFIVVGPVTLPQNLSYYGTDSGGAGNDQNAVQMVIDACTAASAAGVDFSQYDTDNDGVVDNVFLYYAGYNQAESPQTSAYTNLIWPHRSGIYPKTLFPGVDADGYSNSNYTGTVASITFNGKRIMDYSCTSELKGYTGTNMCGVGTFCHEFGHVLGLPDYYDTSGNNKTTLDCWSIMDYGPYLNGGCTPPSYSAYDRFFLGYLTPQQMSVGSDLTLLPLFQGKIPPANTDNQAYLFSATTHNLNGAAPDIKEFFLVEYRKHTGWDTYLGQNIDANGNLTTIPSDGMCIWHIDYNQAAWDNNGPNNYTGSTQTSSSHMRVYLQPLSGSTTTPGTAFTTGSFTPTTWSGTNIYRMLTAISKTTNSVTFKLTPSFITSGSLIGFTSTTGTPSVIQSIQVTGGAFSNNLDIALINKTNFDIKLSSSSTWVKSLSLIPVSGNVNETLQIRYNPTSAGIQSDNISLVSTGATSLNLNLNGTATAPYDPNAPAILIGKIDNSIQFPIIKSGKTVTKTFNIKTTDVISTLTLALTGTDAAMYTVSTSSLAKEAVNATTGTTITVTYQPASIGIHTATLTISGGGLNPAKVISLQGEGN